MDRIAAQIIYSLCAGIFGVLFALCLYALGQTHNAAFIPMSLIFALLSLGSMVGALACRKSKTGRYNY